jgi:hypothetical protein
VRAGSDGTLRKQRRDSQLLFAPEFGAVAFHLLSRATNWGPAKLVIPCDLYLNGGQEPKTEIQDDIKCREVEMDGRNFAGVSAAALGIVLSGPLAFSQTETPKSPGWFLGDQPPTQVDD